MHLVHGGGRQAKINCIDNDQTGQILQMRQQVQALRAAVHQLHGGGKFVPRGQIFDRPHAKPLIRPQDVPDTENQYPAACSAFVLITRHAVAPPPFLNPVPRIPRL
ncbi:hypothetical protein JCM25156A_28030 [Komagataeibacter kakiaceti JCM 25156]